jgi:hypothetical protein
MKDFRFQISDFRLSAAERGGTCFCTSRTRGLWLRRADGSERSASLHPQFLTAHVEQSLGTRRKRVIPRRGDAEGPHKHSHCQQNIFSLAQILMRGPSLSSQLGMTKEINSE